MTGEMHAAKAISLRWFLDQFLKVLNQSKGILAVSYIDRNITILLESIVVLRPLDKSFLELVDPPIVFHLMGMP